MKEVELKRIVKCPHCGKTFAVKGIHKKRAKKKEKNFFERLGDIDL